MNFNIVRSIVLALMMGPLNYNLIDVEYDIVSMPIGNTELITNKNKSIGTSSKKKIGHPPHKNVSFSFLEPSIFSRVILHYLKSRDRSFSPQ